MRMLQWSAFTYWSGLPVDGFEILIRAYSGWAAIGTNDGLTMLVGWPFAESRADKADVEPNDAERRSTAFDGARRSVRRRPALRRSHGGVSPRANAHVLPTFEYTTQLYDARGAARDRAAARAVHGSRDAMDAFVSITAGTVSPVGFFDPDNIGRLMSAAAAS